VPRHTKKRSFVIRRYLILCGALAFAGCGGLAADGGVLAEPEPCPGDGACALATVDGEAEGQAPRVDGASVPRSTMPRSPEAHAQSRLGEACQPAPADDGADSVSVGELSFSENASCGPSNVCLTRAQPDENDCSTATLGPDGACPEQRVVPVPPQLAPALPPLERLCTCRCGGFEEGAEYCSCPAGMSCRELIRTVGTNGAARDYAGSYCL
jgi:hypothetical protein